MVGVCDPTLHLKAAATDIPLDSLDLERPSAASRHYFRCLLQAYWHRASVRIIIADFRAISSVQDICLLQAFCQCNYPQCVQLFSAEHSEE